MTESWNWLARAEVVRRPCPFKVDESLRWELEEKAWSINPRVCFGPYTDTENVPEELRVLVEKASGIPVDDPPPDRVFGSPTDWQFTGDPWAVFTDVGSQDIEPAEDLIEDAPVLLLHLSYTSGSISAAISSYNLEDEKLDKSVVGFTGT